MATVRCVWEQGRIGGQPVANGLDDEGYGAVVICTDKRGVQIAYLGAYEYGSTLHDDYIRKGDVVNRLRHLQQECTLVGH